ncbi:dnaJ homolog subfamily C member 17-like [Argiope bruennichi]|uniref:DnaJ homolog subfamily C member 17 n=1 Tax=Argiope bruennichi TaxID=94029 RepID=A0A8T0F6L4_ARGBR|nr:dnaJ homolog subfamily C member 17-like [Argiope bruennichi]KAF8786826.1 DnaJ subfamily C member 17 like protein [Argiope bruennichi]
MEDLMKIDLYELLNISVKAEEKEIKKAYRKKALTCHPDKNPDNPKAAELFQQLSKALEILTDKAARAAYDKVLNARKAAQIRHRELDSKRKKLKEDLEAREKAASTQEFDEKDSAETLEKEIERLRREGSKLVEEEKERLKQEILKENSGATPSHNKSQNEVMPRLKVRWKSHKSDETNGGYNQEALENLFKKYGQVLCLVSSKKNGSAILEFTSSTAAQLAFESEKGDPKNPLTLSWICGQPELPNNSRFTSQPTVKGPAPEPGKDSALTSRDYESLVLMKLRQAEERKKLIQQMMEEDD